LKGVIRQGLFHKCNGKGEKNEGDDAAGHGDSFLLAWSIFRLPLAVDNG